MKKLKLLLLVPLLLLASCEKEYNECIHYETSEQVIHYVCSDVKIYVKSDHVYACTRDYGNLELYGNFVVYKLPRRCPVCGWEE